jgi:hypothetical protein
MLSMAYLSYLHLKRQFLENASGYSLDITGIDLSIIAELEIGNSMDKE